MSGPYGGPVAYVMPPSFATAGSTVDTYGYAPPLQHGFPVQVQRQQSRGPGPMPRLLAGDAYTQQAAGAWSTAAPCSEQAIQYCQQQQQQQHGSHLVQPPYDTTPAPQVSLAPPASTPLWLQTLAQPAQPSLAAQAAAITPAGVSSAAHRHVEMPRLGRGLYYSSAMSGHLDVNEAGLAGAEASSPHGKGHGHASPTAGSKSGSDRQRGCAFAAGFGVGGDAGDALDSFQAQAHSRHAGKATASSLSFSDAPSGTSPVPTRSASPAPWEALQAPSQAGVRTFFGAAAKTDHLSNGEAGILGPEASQGRIRGPGLAPGDQMGGLSRMGSAGAKGPLGLGGEAESYLASRHLGAHAGARSHSSIKQTEMGLVQQGHDMLSHKAFAGKTQASQLQFGEGGMHRQQQGLPPAVHAHAGKITASSLMPGEFGISGSAKPPVRNPSSGDWATSYDYAYRP